MMPNMENNISSFVIRQNNTNKSVEIIKVNGKLLKTEATAVLRQVREAINCMPKKIIIDLNDVFTINVSGTQAIRESSNLCHKNGIEFELVSYSDAIINMISSPDLSLVTDPSKPIIDFLYSESIPIGVECTSDTWKMYEFIALADASAIPILREKILEAASITGASEDVLTDIQIASGEALTNAYKHGSPKKGLNKIKLRFMICTSVIAVEIEDEGEPFNHWTNYLADPIELRDHGMGIFLMKESMDKVEFFSGMSGNKVRMLKWLQKNESKQYANAM
ncbi:MAG: ATP-binding protein [Armatimonadota bacterium]